MKPTSGNLDPEQLPITGMSNVGTGGPLYRVQLQPNPEKNHLYNPEDLD